MGQRREIADRVIARWKERGFTLDADPHYMQIGGIEMRERYAQLLRLRADKRAGRVLAPGLQPSSIGHEIEDGPDGSDESLQRMDEEPPAGFAPPRETD